MKLTITIQCDNDAFSSEKGGDSEPGTEVARILRELADNYQERDLLPGETANLRDINGNTVGKAKVTS